MESMPLEGYSYKIDEKNRIIIMRSIVVDKYIYIHEDTRSVYAGWIHEAEICTAGEIRFMLEGLGIWDKIERKP